MLLRFNFWLLTRYARWGCLLMPIITLAYRYINKYIKQIMEIIYIYTLRVSREVYTKVVRNMQQSTLALVRSIINIVMILSKPKATKNWPKQRETIQEHTKNYPGSVPKRNLHPTKPMRPIIHYEKQVDTILKEFSHSSPHLLLCFSL